MQKTLVALTMVVGVFASNTVRAQYTSTVRYTVTAQNETANKVCVVATQTTVPLCSDEAPDGGAEYVLVRQKVGTGEVVAIPHFCATDEPGCYLDECVPAGTYRYGYVPALRCERNCMQVEAYRQIISPGAASDCQRTSGNPGPTAYSGTVPWTGQIACQMACPSGESTSGTGTSGTATSAAPGSSGGASSGASISRASSTASGTDTSEPPSTAGGGDDDDDDTSACACTTSAGQDAAWLAALGLLVIGFAVSSRRQ